MEKNNLAYATMVDDAINETHISHQVPTYHLDGDIWVATRLGGQDKTSVTSRFSNLADEPDITAMAGKLNEEQKLGRQYDVVYQFIHVDQKVQERKTQRNHTRKNEVKTNTTKSNKVTNRGVKGQRCTP
jgi:hypothetical protein